MIQINNIRLKPGYTEQDVLQKLAAARIPGNASWQFIRLSLDARRKNDIHYTASAQVSWDEEKAFLRRNRDSSISSYEPVKYQIPVHGREKPAHRPVIIGAGPAGLFAARLLAEAGYAPVLLERGAPVEERMADVGEFWKNGRLKPDSNVQFGEGGAGTFSDGKLNTQIKDQDGRIRQVLEWFVESGADPSVLWWNKPHIGTDVLTVVVRNLRNKILSLGGEIRFHTKLTGIRTENGRLTGVELEDENQSPQYMEAETVILAVGHSARDTFEMLEQTGVPMHAKAFAVGVRIEHPQEMIQLSQYGTADRSILPAADYKLTGKAEDGRGVYSFCMCPGGQVVNASSEEYMTAVNGMSASARDGRNANSALVVTVTPEDFPDPGALGGIRFQRKLERLAWESGEGKIPVQLWRDFRQNCPSTRLGEVLPDIRGGFRTGDVRNILPSAVQDALISQIPAFGRKIPGYDRDDAVLSGVESRTSSPVRIERDEGCESRLRGIYPCGEGAGYAGGITSAAVDGIRVAEAVIRRYEPWI